MEVQVQCSISRSPSVVFLSANKKVVNSSIVYYRRTVNTYSINGMVK